MSISKKMLATQLVRILEYHLSEGDFQKGCDPEQDCCWDGSCFRDPVGGLGVACEPHAHGHSQARKAGRSKKLRWSQEHRSCCHRFSDRFTLLANSHRSGKWPFWSLNSSFMKWEEYVIVGDVAMSLVILSSLMALTSSGPNFTHCETAWRRCSLMRRSLQLTQLYLEKSSSYRYLRLFDSQDIFAQHNSFFNLIILGGYIIMNL